MSLCPDNIGVFMAIGEREETARVIAGTVSAALDWPLFASD